MNTWEGQNIKIVNNMPVFAPSRRDHLLFEQILSLGLCHIGMPGCRMADLCDYNVLWEFTKLRKSKKSLCNIPGWGVYLHKHPISYRESFLNKRGQWQRRLEGFRALALFLWQRMGYLVAKLLPEPTWILGERLLASRNNCVRLRNTDLTYILVLDPGIHLLFFLTAYLSPIIHNIPESWGIFLMPCRIQ